MVPGARRRFWASESDDPRSHFFFRKIRPDFVGARIVRILKSPMRILNVAEKPSVAAALSKILSSGRPQQRSGRGRAQQIHEFQYSLPNVGPCQMVMTSVLGHMMTCEFAHPFK